MTSPTIYPRGAWNARSWREFTAQGEPHYAFVHHSDDPDGRKFNTLARQADHVRGIQNFHMDDPAHEWDDIAYHFLIFQYTGVKVLRNEPRAFMGRPVSHVPAAQLDFNSNTLAICVVGNGEKEALHTPTRKLIADIIRMHPTVHTVRPHSANPRHPDGTDCPGSHFRAALPDVAKLARVALVAT